MPVVGRSLQACPRGTGAPPARRLVLCGVLALALGAGPGEAQEQAANGDQVEQDPALEEQPSVEQRLEQERAVGENPFGITPHRINYFLPITYNDNPNPATFEALGNRNFDRWEIKFQLSFKVPVWQQPLGANSQLSFAYTQQSFWQAYNAANSSPFRETNHEPEVFLGFLTDQRIFGFTNRVVALGAAHQSNGRSDPQSRSWNRLYALFILERNNLVVSIKPWWRIPEDAADDDNPDIEDFLGHGELHLLYVKGPRSRSALVRYNPDTNKGALQLEWTFPLKRKIKGYLQYFNGYGESLIDYDSLSHRIGLGVLLTDWL